MNPIILYVVGSAVIMMGFYPHFNSRMGQNVKPRYWNIQKYEPKVVFCNGFIFITDVY
jgi:hypothetical protein